MSIAVPKLIILQAFSTIIHPLIDSNSLFWLKLIQWFKDSLSLTLATTTIVDFCEKLALLAGWNQHCYPKRFSLACDKILLSFLPIDSYLKLLRLRFQFVFTFQIRLVILPSRWILHRTMESHASLLGWSDLGLYHVPNERQKVSKESIDYCYVLDRDVYNSYCVTLCDCVERYKQSELFVSSYLWSLCNGPVYRFDRFDVLLWLWRNF